MPKWDGLSWNGAVFFDRFEGHVPGGNWVTVGYRFPPGRSLEVHFGSG